MQLARNYPSLGNDKQLQVADFATRDPEGAGTGRGVAMIVFMLMKSLSQTCRVTSIGTDI